MAARRPIRVAKVCEKCGRDPAAGRRVSGEDAGRALCRECFCTSVEATVRAAAAATIAPGDRVALAVSGGKDSAVLAHIVSARLGGCGAASLALLAVDEGIAGYRDCALGAVRRAASALALPLLIVSFSELYGGVDLDVIVRQRGAGARNACSWCGALRRQAFDRGAVRLGANKVATGHCADDNAETVLLNLLRGDSARLHSCSSSCGVGDVSVPRIKPLAGLAEREVVLYAHLRHLDYFATECPYASGAFRGHARALVKQLEAVRPAAVLDIVRSGEAFALQSRRANKEDEEEKEKKKEWATCPRCGYLSSTKGALCQACKLLTSISW